MAPLPDWTAAAPAILLGLTAIALLIIDSISPRSKNRNLLAGTTLVGTLAALAAAVGLLVTGTGTNGGVAIYGGQIVVDGMSLFFTIIFTSVAALVTLASYDYLAGENEQAEYYALVMLATTGMAMMASAGSLALVFVSFELLSLPSYALVAFLKDNRGSVEASLKYLLVGALSSAILLYGISLVYGVTGGLSFETIAANIQNSGLTGMLGIGVLMVLGGFAFKTASVPFHFWAPEAYEGAPGPISAFLSSASKAAGFVVAFRVFTVAFGLDIVSSVDWVLAFQVLAIVTMTLGNFAAATQDNVKRMLAYSSVGQAGYVLIGLAALGGGQDALVLGMSMTHLLVYGFMNTGAFLFIALAEHWDIGRTFADYNGLGSQAPIACAAMSVFMLSLAGIPLGGGFLSKYFLFGAAVGAGFWWLAAIAIVNSVLSLYYYLRVVRAMWFEESNGDRTIEGYPLGLYTAVIAAAVVTVLLIPAFNFVADPAVDAAAALF
ncbi:NADH-quinone oxidoreductase subunit N [Halococcus thailandensis]|uniref:Proton-translocating NADH-quinone oxidoreductase, chain N n=1 Tax=Halococcus thailandensis JCM 13552 TaxID=1227457 RepID=M0MZY3_9EURY|nr:NADH-quinone oxidoreductase subunit N [Halococcus thailandensis]EMA50394.1 proton-translocating NADH-quinone oxidoreductase, chain N [Halococcus thailandensis JCM 13552]